MPCLEDLGFMGMEEWEVPDNPVCERGGQIPEHGHGGSRPESVQRHIWHSTPGAIDHWSGPTVL